MSLDRFAIELLEALNNVTEGPERLVTPYESRVEHGVCSADLQVPGQLVRASAENGRAYDAQNRFVSTIHACLTKVRTVD